MKKLLCLALAAAMTLTLAACGAGGAASSSPSTSSASGSAASGSGASGVDWPTGTVSVYCPYAAGGDTDTYCRAMCKQLGDYFGVNFIVINEEGGSGIVAAKDVMSKKADGYSILFNHTGASLVQEATKTADFSYTNDFSNIATVAQDNTYVIVAKKEKGWSSLTDLQAAAKATPSTIRYSQVYGSVTHYVVAQMEEYMGIELDKIDVGTSSSDRLAALLGDQVDVLAVNYMNVADYVENGQLVVLGICADEPVLGLENLPTCTSQGFPIVCQKNYEMKFPKGTDQAIVDLLTAAVEKCCANQEFIDTLASYHAESFYRGPDQMNQEDPATVEELASFFAK
ncbi:hypothetical protein OBV_45170 [Oscillibacter valericigenes Sjm18-20]|nr:hypothetical protein OBV_45170 [Oscillibacter valericigenes Sjm18-20]